MLHGIRDDANLLDGKNLSYPGIDADVQSKSLAFPNRHLPWQVLAAADALGLLETNHVGARSEGLAICTIRPEAEARDLGLAIRLVYRQNPRRADLRRRGGRWNARTFT